MNILFIGDIVGNIGRKVVIHSLPILIEKYDIDFVIANAENISKGKGMTKEDYLSLKKAGVDCVTLGNHYNSKKQIYDFLDSDDIVRPINIKDEKIGKGSRVFEVNDINIRVTNCLGEVYMNHDVYDPYETLSDLIINSNEEIHIIDFHAEATGEKKAVALALKNTITAFLGTHTHVQTNDAQILNSGVAYISDVGMCGSYNSILGSEISSVIDKVVYKKENAKLKILDNDDTLFNGVVIKIDDITFEAKKIIPLSSIERI